MHSLTASLSSKLLSFFFAASLAFGLVPSAAFAASDDLQSIPEGSEGAAPIASSAEGGSNDVFSHCPSDNAPSADGDSAVISSEDVFGGKEFAFINQDTLLDATASQAKFTKTSFLAKTLESTRTVSVVSAKVPLSRGDKANDVASASTVTGAFEYCGMIFAIEADGASVALVAADYSVLLQEFIEKQMVVIPDAVTADGIDFYSVTRIANGAFASFKKENANPNYIGCESLFSDEGITFEDIPSQAVSTGVDNEEHTEDSFCGTNDSLARCAGILALYIPTCVTSIEEDSLAGFETLQYVIVSEGNTEYASYDGALYDIGLAELLIVPEGRVGTLNIASSTVAINHEVFAHCFSLSALVVDADLLMDDASFGGQEEDSIKVIAASKDANRIPIDESPYLSFARNQAGSNLAEAPNLDTESALYSEDAMVKSAGIKSNLTIQWQLPSCYTQTSTFAMESGTGLYCSIPWAIPEEVKPYFLGIWDGTGTQIYDSGGYHVPGFYWKDGNHYAVTYAVTGWARWKPFLRLDMNGGTATMWGQPGKASMVYDGSYSYSCTTDSAVSIPGSYSVAYLYSRPNYLFAGWSADKNCEPEKASGFMYAGEAVVCYYAVWKIKSYDITYDLDGGSVDPANPNSYTHLSTFTLNKPTRTGYAFAGWTGTDLTEATKTVTIASGSTGARAYTATWISNTYTVDFNVNGGSGGQSTSVTATYAANMPVISTTKPTRTGYEFMGWYDNADYAASDATQYYTAGGASARTWDKASKATLYAGWKANNYTITWNPQDGIVDTEGKTSQTFGNELSLPPTPTREGYTFAGWWTTSGEDPSDPGTEVVEGTTMVPSSNATYFAHWDKVPGTVTLKSEGGSFTQEQVNAFNSAVGDHPTATLYEGDMEIEIPFDVDTKSFSLDLLKPTLTGSSFAGWSPAFVAPSWNPGSLSWNNAVTYTATWDTNVYGVTYQDKGGNPLVGWSAWEGGPSLESKLPQTFNEATPAEGRELPEKPYKLGYTWGKWTREDTGATVTSIPKVSNPITIVANFTADEYTVGVDLTGGEGTGWLEEYVRTYDDPTVELPSDKPKRAGYVFSGIKAYASTDEDAPAVFVIDTATNASVDTLQPGKTYKVLNLTDGEGNIYDVKLLRAVWTPRIAVDVTPSVDMGILADFGTNSLKFQCGGTDYVAGDTDDAYAPIEFVSYTTAPVGIVAVTDDTQDAGYATRAAFAEKVFGGASNKAKVSFTISADPTGANSHSFSLGGSTAPSATGFLDGLTIAKPTGAETSKTTPFYLGMDFEDLAATDLLTKESGQIAKLYYTVALIGDPESSPSVLAPYDGNGILW